VIPESFYQTLRYQATARPADILADLRQCDAIRKVHEDRRGSWLTALILSIILTVGLAALSCALLAVAPWVIILAVAGVVAVIFSGVQMYRAGRLILDRRRYHLAGEVLRHLACDMRRDATATLTLDFNNYHQDRYRTGTGRVSNYQLSSYELPWLALETPLIDGNRLRLETAMQVKRKERAKKKYTKVKEMLWEDVTLTLKVKADNVDVLQRWPGLLRERKLPGEAFVKKAQADGARLTVQAQTIRQMRLKDRSSTTNAQADQQLANEHLLLMLCLASYEALGACGTGGGAA
jgi:hypothetical protein